MHHGTVTVAELIGQLEGCDPDAEVRLAHQPTWPFTHAIDPGNAAVQVEGDDTTVVDLGEGTQLGDLPRPSASNSAASRIQRPQEQAMTFNPGDRVELVATTDPFTDLRPGDRGTVTGVRGFPEPTIDIHWDDGSTLSILPDAGDRIRKLPDGQPTHDSGQAPGAPPPSPPGTATGPATSARPGSAGHPCSAAKPSHPVGQSDDTESFW
jgi:hypothetical protein